MYFIATKGDFNTNDLSDARTQVTSLGIGEAISFYLQAVATDRQGSELEVTRVVSRSRAYQRGVVAGDDDKRTYRRMPRGIYNSSL